MTVAQGNESFFEDFFSIENTYTKCKRCSLNTKKNKEIVEKKKTEEETKIFLNKYAEVIVINDSPESARNVAFALESLSYTFGESKVAMLDPIQCRLKKNESIPARPYEVYNRCGLITEEKLYEMFPNLKAIVVCGKALHSVTGDGSMKGATWHNFTEGDFNPTYFYPPIGWERKPRIYPVPYLSSWQTSTLARAFFRSQMKRVKEFVSSDIQPFEVEGFEKIIVEDPNKFLRDNMGKYREVVIDTETSGLNIFEENFRIGCITMAFNSTTGYYLDFTKLDKELLSEFLKNTPMQIYANGKYDTKALRRVGVSNAVVGDDVTLSFHILNTVRSSNSIKALAWLLGLGRYDEPLEEYMKKYKPETYLDIPEDTLAPYAIMDAIVTFRLYKLSKKLWRRQPRAYKCYIDYVIPVMPVFEDMEMVGMDVKLEMINEVGEKLLKKSEEDAEKIFDIFGRKFKLNSPQELGVEIKRAKWPKLGSTKTGHWSVGSDQLENWARLGFEAAEHIISYRTATKLYSAFVGEYTDDTEEDYHESFFRFPEKKSKKGLVKFLQFDNKIHPDYMPARTNTGRSLCRNPNVQQFPKQGDIGKIFRPLIKAPDGYSFFDADYSGFQLRVAAILSKDSVMRDIFLNKGADMHSVTARDLFARDVTIEFFLEHKEESPYKEYRQMAKCFVAGTKIKTSKGDLAVEDFVPEVNSGKFTPYVGDIKLKNRHGDLKEMESTFFDYADKTIEFVLKNGDVFEVTPNHWFYVLRDGKEIEVQAWEIQETDEFIDVKISICPDMGMGIYKIIKKKHDKPVKVYCFHEPDLNECLVVGKSKTPYVSKQTINFAFVFGAGAGTLLGDLNKEWSIDQMKDYIKENNLEVINFERKPSYPYTVARSFRDRFFETYPELNTWLEEVAMEASQIGYSDSIMGWRRHLPILTLEHQGVSDEKDKKTVAGMRRIAVNSPVQNFEASIVYGAMTKIHYRLKESGMKSRIFAMIHDSIAGYVYKPEAEALYHLLKDCMEDHTSYDIPLLSDVEFGPIWGFGKKANDKSVVNFQFA